MAAPLLGALVNVMSGVAASLAASAAAKKGKSPATQQAVAVAVGTAVHGLGQLATSALDASKGLADARKSLSMWNNLIAASTVELTLGRMMRERKLASEISGTSSALLRATNEMEESWQTWRQAKGTFGNLFSIFMTRLSQAGGSLADFALKTSGVSKFAKDIEVAMGKKPSYSPLGEAWSEFAWAGKFGGQRPEWVPDKGPEGGHWESRARSPEQKAADAAAEKKMQDQAASTVVKKSVWATVGSSVAAVAMAPLGALAPLLGAFAGLNAVDSPPYNKAPGEK